MATTPEQARRAAEKYLEGDIMGRRVSKLYEDRTDYLVETESDGPTPVDSTFIFIRKSNGEVWLGTPGEHLDKVFAMEEITSA